MSVLGGVAREALGDALEWLGILDMVAQSQETFDPVTRFIEDGKPDIVGISVPYGGFTILQREAGQLLEAVGDRAWLVFGGPLATVLPARILRLFGDALCVRGEGEVAFAAILRSRLRASHLDRRQIPGAAYLDGGRLTTNERVLTNLLTVPPPVREHIGAVVATGGQVFGEASRGCSWAVCRFCLRGLTDISGSRKERRHFPPERLRADLHVLVSLGVEHVTFADEDFLGSGIEDMRTTVESVTACARSVPRPITFDASVMPHSVFSGRSDSRENEERRRLIAELRSAGLRKAFLGIESGAPDQLKRYAKGHTPEGAMRAVDVLRAEGVTVEVGWIMFDPLCTREDLLQNCTFLRRGRLVGSISNIFGELRLQTGSRYLKLLREREREFGLRLCVGDVDPDTLSHSFRYEDPQIEVLVQEVQRWTDRLRVLHYPLKSLTRFGGSPLGADAPAARDVLDQLRWDAFGAFETLLLEADGIGRSARSAFETVEDAAQVAVEDLKPLLERHQRALGGQTAAASLFDTVAAWRRERFRPLQGVR